MELEEEWRINDIFYYIQLERKNKKMQALFVSLESVYTYGLASFWLLP